MFFSLRCLGTEEKRENNKFFTFRYPGRYIIGRSDDGRVILKRDGINSVIILGGIHKTVSKDHAILILKKPFMKKTSLILKDASTDRRTFIGGWSIENSDYEVKQGKHNLILGNVFFDLFFQE